MDDLETTQWDVIIAGTGLPQSLLALALSRSDKKILHVDKNAYYGGAEAAFSLQEAEEWANSVKQDKATAHSRFMNAAVTRPSSETKPGFSRAYSLTLSPQLIYASSPLVPALVSSKLYKQLEFLAVGTWWVYTKPSDDGSSTVGSLVKVPGGREDIFTDTSLQPRAKRTLMKCLKFVATYEEQTEVWEGYRSRPFSEFLSEAFNVPASLQDPLHALTLTAQPPELTTTAFALLRIAKHLRSIGVFGPGFGTIIPKWGGLNEIAQLACRAGAVGGALDVLDNGLVAREDLSSQDTPSETTTDTHRRSTWRLKGGEKVSTMWLVGQADDLPPHSIRDAQSGAESSSIRTISIISSPLAGLLPALGEGSPPPAGAVIVFPSRSLDSSQAAPINVFLHSSETGECPNGQSVLYASTLHEGESSEQYLEQAIKTLLQCVNEVPKPEVMWSLRYRLANSGSKLGEDADDQTVVLPPLSPDLTFDETILNQVKAVWQKIMGPEAEDLLVFENREGTEGDDDDEA